MRLVGEYDVVLLLIIGFSFILLFYFPIFYTEKKKPKNLSDVIFHDKFAELKKKLK